MPSPEDLPQPDLIDSAGRMRRIIVSLLVGGAVGALAYFIANARVEPDTQPRATYVAHNMSAGGFVLWVGMISAVVAFTIALAVQNHLAKKQSARERVPPAKVV